MCAGSSLLSLYTGGRAGAVLDLTWLAVDLDAGLIAFRADGEAETNKRRGRARMTRRLRAHMSSWRDGHTHVIHWRGS